MEAQVQQPISYDELLDVVELKMHKNGLVHIEPIHEFTPGIYTRSIIVPAGVYLLSYIHNTEHQFIMSKGDIVIYTKDAGMIYMHAPYLGKTYPGDRRFAKTLTEVVWTSIHATDIMPKDDSEEALKEAVEAVEKEIFNKRENIYLIQLKENEEWQALQQPQSA